MPDDDYVVVSQPPAPNLATPPPLSQELQVTQSVSTGRYDLQKIVLSDPKLEWDQKMKLINEIRKSTPASDRWTFRWAIWILGLIVLLSIVAIWSLGLNEVPIPEGLVALGSAAAGGLAGLLTPRNSNSGSANN
jgi:hypothetical protein